MKVDLPITIFIFSILLSSCSGNSKSGVESPIKKSRHDKPVPQIAPGSPPISESGSDLAHRIQVIKKERGWIDLFHDWTEVKSKDVWGIEGVGLADYYYIGKELKLIRFDPVENTEGRRYWFYYNNDELILGRLEVELKIDMANNECSPGTAIAIGNAVPKNMRFADYVAKVEKAVKIDYILNCYFENDRVFHDELINMSGNKHDASKIEKEKLGMKEELKALIEAENN